MLFETNGVQMYYELHGDPAGEPLLWLHGFGGSGADWKYVFKEAPEGFRLIAPDLRGHGSSTVLETPYSFRESARDVIGLLDHLHVTKAKAIGLSGGGITLLHLATMEPKRLDAIVLVSAPPYFPEQARAIQRNFTEAMMPEAEMVRMRERHKGGEKQVRWVFEQARAFADATDDPNFGPEELGKIEARTLIVFGDADPFYPVSIAHELHDAIAGSQLWIVPGGGHGPIFGAAAPEFTKTALEFLNA